MALTMEEKEKIKKVYEDDELDYVEEGDWVDCGKHQYIESIVTCKDFPNRCFKISTCRSGSYWSDYDYDLEIIEVKKAEKIVIEWVPVKKMNFK